MVDDASEICLSCRVLHVKKLRGVLVYESFSSWARTNGQNSDRFEVKETHCKGCGQFLFTEYLPLFKVMNLSHAKRWCEKLRTVN